MSAQSIDQGDTIVAVAGDWHGNRAWAERALRELAQRDVRTVYHLGDFGIRPDEYDRDPHFLEPLNNLCAKLGINVWVTPGNHENWSWLDRLFENGNGLDPQNLLTSSHDTGHLRALPRGYRWQHAGRSFVSLGGAPSIDYEQRIPGQDWWIEETIPPSTAAAVADAGHAEIMLAHDAPNHSPAVQQAIRRPSPYSAEARVYAAGGRECIDTAFAGVRPRLFCHGHYHLADESFVDGTRLLSLGRDGEPGNLALIDLASDELDIEWVDL